MTDGITDITNDVSKMSYEQALEELQSIVARLEKPAGQDGALSLDEAIKFFERGEVLSKRCEELLQVAEAKIQEAKLEEAGAQEDKFGK